MSRFNRILKILLVLFGIGAVAIILILLVYPNLIKERFAINEYQLLCEDGDENACKQLAKSI